MEKRDELFCRLLFGQLKSLGLFVEKKSLIADLKTKTGLSDLYHRWLEQSIAVLARNNYLSYDGESYTVIDTIPVDIEATWKEWDGQKKAWLEVPHLKAQVVLVDATLRALPEILTGNVPATDIIFPNSSVTLVEGIYKNNPVADYFNEVLANTVVAYIEECLLQDPSAKIRIIEIGAGTGGTSALVFQKLRPYRDHVQEYLYTDISKAFILYAEKEYGPQNSYLTCKSFNVEVSIAEQDIVAGGYDIAIAANVLHATKSIRQTIRNVKGVLRNNGLILLNEISSNSLFSHLTFGLLEGWWRYEDPVLRIKGCPGLYPETWQGVLESEGFQPVFFPAEEAHDLGQQIVVGKSDGIVRQKKPTNSSVATLRQYVGLIPSPICKKNLQLSNVQDNHLPIQKIRPTYSGVDITDQMVEGHVRTIIRESIAEALKMKEVQIQDNRNFSEYGVDSIIAVNLVNLINKQNNITLQTTVLFDYNNVDQLTRYIIREHKSALISLMQKNMTISEGTSIDSQRDATPISQENPNLTNHNNNLRWKRNRFIAQDVKSYSDALVKEYQRIYHRVIIEGPGGIKDIRLVQSVVPELKENEVRIAVRAFSLNFGDLLCIKGLYPTMPPYPFTPGFEASGVVVGLGHGVTLLKQGDAVIVTMGEALGRQASMITCSAEQVIKKPDNLSFEEACTLPVVSMTMIAAFRKAQLKRGESILIQTAAGGIGLIAIQLAQYYGAEIYATAGSQQKLDYLKKHGISYLINYQETDFEKEIQRLTHGRGVDVVINTLPGDAIQKGLNCLATGGRYIEIAMTALKSARTVDLSVLCNNQTFYSIDLRKLGLEDPVTLKECQKEMARLVAERIIQPSIYKVFTLDQTEEAYRCMERRENIGKIVVRINEEYQFRATKPAESAMQLQKDPIAIIGLSGRFAKSRTVHELWKHLAEGNDLVEEDKRWNLSEYYTNFAQETKSHCNYGSFVDDIDKFDPLFFNISGLEATYMDPQQRIFLEESWKALEDAGYVGDGIRDRSCGVYVGCSASDYQQLFGSNPPAQAFWGNAGSVIPARIAYYLDLHGPAVAIDTACSSSLVAIHLACQSLWAKETELALAGGVFIQSTPGFYLYANRAEMLSPTGRCHAFDDRANGFVPGEGIGVVVLKRLQEAIADGDHIYGVIRGSGINQDGSTNGITAPSANSQERLEHHVYETFGIHPEEIHMIEAHGTGTRLGDPIEYQALTKAFRRYTDKKEYCAIGSIKTNIGHAATAAGVAGVIKVLLALQHKKIPPSLHFESGNSNIKFKGSPFYVNTSLKDWNVQPGVKCCAAISSFGFSGTNAHMVIEEAPKLEWRHSEKPGYLITLSARTYEQLQQQAQQLVDFCNREPQIDCGNMSYTLILGRYHFNHRLACVVRNKQELITFLKKWLEKGKVLQVYVSELRENDHREQHSLKLYGNQCVQKCQSADDASEYLEYLSAIADLYVQGYKLEFEQLYSSEQYSRISLPTYPFAKERYWIPENKSIFGGITVGSELPPAIIHPLLHQNTSDLSEQRFSSTFTGKEFFLADHVVKGQRILPGVAYLEMARAAVEQAAGAIEEGRTGIRLKNVVWARPIVVGEQPMQVNIALFPEDNGEIAYEIYSDPEADDAEPVVHSQGSAVLNSVAEVPALDLKALQAQCCQGNLSPTQCYEAFKAMGLHYGPGHQGIEQVYLGSEQVLAKLSLPPSVSSTEDNFVLHPSMMDSALQAPIGLMMGTGDTMLPSVGALKPAFPFALEELEIISKCTSAMWAFIRYSDGSKAGDKVQKLDIDLCDEQGNVCVRIKGFASRVLEGEVASAGSAANIGTLLIRPCWREQAVAQETAAPEYVQHLIILCEPGEISRESIETQMNNVRCLTLQSEHKGVEDRFQTYATQTFEKIQNILKDKPKGKVLIQVVVTTQDEQQLFTGLSGLLKTAQLENPKLIGQLIEIEPGEDSEGIIEKLKENSQSPLDNYVRYQGGKRLLAGWSEVKLPREAERIPWKDRGVYLISGGTGGLGLIFAKEIVRKAKDATLILTGRSSLNEDKQSKLKELEALDARIEYKQIDVTQKKAVVDLIQSIQEDFGIINGIIHAAGVIRDNFILKKTREELQEVLAPKVTGLVNLDEASKGLGLDFFILFSSGAGVMGNVGQADYAAANAFMDAYAKYRNTLVASNQRQGQTLSVNWPLWKEGGMRVDEETEKVMTQSTGMIPMQTSTGIRALYQSLASGKDQVIVMEGDLKQLHAALIDQQSGSEASKTSSSIEENKVVPAIAQDLLHEKATNYFKKLLSSVIKLPVHRIEADAPMEKYGIDSIMVMQMTNQLEKTFGSLSKTLFFEYQYIKDLTGYFLESYRDQLIELLGIADEATATTEYFKDSLVMPESKKPALSSRRRQRFASITIESQQEKATGALDIAIIGVSGRYPQAKNIREFWKNLQDGKDCITEIPKDRWDHSLYFDEDKNKAGKTYSKWGGFLDGVDQFDPLFFNISPREAEFIDPQERLFLECVYETLEDAGYTRETLGSHQGFGLEGNVGVYVGVMYEEYQLYGAQEQILGRPVAFGGNPSSIANRVSYFCNFHGPSMAVDTMCSSSLTAIHLACQSLQRGGCEVAIAGGVNVSIHPNKYLMLAQGKFVSSKGRCESFGQGGDGYVPGEGVGAVLLKPLSQAIADGDHIYGIIKGSAINHDGKTNGYSVPNPNAQASVIGRALKEAGIDPRTVSYIEAHGTGTSLGDPIEISGLTKIFREHTKDKHFCAIGSAKSNIGHCESVAGIAGLTKVLLQLRYSQLVPSLHSEVLNPNIDFSNTPFVVQQELLEWKRPVIEVNGETKEYPRIAGISCFGAGGSNAHIVIEEYIPSGQPRPIITITPQNPAIIVLSAKNEERLTKRIIRLLAAIEEQEFFDASLADMAYTLQVGREAMEERLAVIVGSINELAEKLKRHVEGQGDIKNLYRGQVKLNKETLAIFTADKELQEAIDKWFQRRKYGKLLEMWVKGLKIDWSKLYDDQKPNRISLPTYPFAEEHYWVPEGETNSVGNSAKVNPGGETPGGEEATVKWRICYLQKHWEVSLTTSARRGNVTVAILTTPETKVLADELSRHLPKSEILDIHNIQAHLLQTEREWKKYDCLVDLTGCGRENSRSVDWIQWLQQLIEFGNKEGLMILGVTKGLESYQNSTVNLSGASRAGLYRMLQSEYRYLRSRHMDADPSIDNSVLADQIASELLMNSEEPEICYRNGKRYRAFLSEIREADEGNKNLVFPEDNVLWITGGTRGLGYLCARHFIERYGVRKLVLTGREIIPPREHWDFYKEQNSAIAKKFQAIHALEVQGVEVNVLSVSLTDELALRQSLQEVNKSMGPIGGIIHCAGIRDHENPAFIRKSLDCIQQVLEPKVTSLDMLYQIFKDEPLQFFILFSSVSAIIPSLAPGHSDYAMANAYMDYFAEAKIHDCPIFSIQWPNWIETGMGVVKSKAYQETGLLGMKNAEGLQLLDNILFGKMGPVVIPAVVNPDFWKPDGLMRRKTKDAFTESVVSQRLTMELLKTKDTLVKAVEEWLTELFSTELKMSTTKLETDIPFQDYGMDSVLLIQILRAINQRLNQDIDPSILYEYFTVESLAQWLANNYGSKLAKTLNISSSGHPISPTKASLPVLPDSSIERPTKRGLQVGDDCYNYNSTDIAVIGLSCRFPGAGNLNEYWKLLSEGRSEIRPVNEERWGYLSNFYAGLINNITNFAPKFFRIPADDVRAMDPQALVILEESLNLWYHAGYNHQEIKGKSVGVFLGARSQHQPNETKLQRAKNAIVAVGQNYLAANISQFFDLRGPSVVVDTACSSALVGMNMAIHALLSDEIESAMVGGVSLLVTDAAHRIFQQRGILRRDPSFHIFDKRADGVVLGEGAGLVLLKTVKQALADGDNIYAVIKAVAINNDGRTAGPATPNLQAQKEVMQIALTKSMKNPQDISYIESNGSGSEVTDLLELKAIQSIYRSANTATCGLGSIKPNIGHPLSAEGIASFIKVVLMIYKKQFVPFLSGEQPMRHFNIKLSPFYFYRKLTEWEGTPRIAAINCFADGGTNAHVILESWENPASRPIKRFPMKPPQLERFDFSNSEVGVYPVISSNDKVINPWKQKNMEG